MRLQQINVEGFGTLSRCRIDGLTDHLNVIHGVNGSGKTTLMHFLTGVFCGFGPAHRLKLLPPLKAGTPGGSVTVQNSQGRFDVIRHARADQSDTLALSLLQGTVDDVTALRKTIQNIPENLFCQLYAVSSYAAHDLSGLVRLARNENVDLSSRSSTGAWISTRVREMEAERADLFRTAPNQGTLTTLEQKREQLAGDLVAARQIQQLQLEQWQQSLCLLREKIDRLTQQRDWQDQELQAVQCDLSETQDRLWSTREQLVQEVETVSPPVSPIPSPWVAQLKAIDLEIAHAQQVLRDLAGHRMTLSVSRADLAGAETPDAQTTLQRQRHALSLIETQTIQLTSILSTLQDSSHCVCGPRSAQLQMGVDAIRDQVWLICQELGRQQSALQQETLRNQREGIDRCEQELIQQVQRLRIRRDDVLRNQARHATDQVHFRTAQEAEGCQCAGHDEAVVNWSSPMEPGEPRSQVILKEKRVTISAARPGDARREIELLQLKATRHKRLAETVEQLRQARVELQQLDQGAREFAGDHSVQTLSREFLCVEQELADAREQWQSLTLLQTVLMRTQQKLNAEAISPVIVEASRYLDRMTEGRYPRFRWDSDVNELFVINGADGELPAQALSRGTLEQAVLCFRLALCEEFHRRGHDFPLILDDILTDSDEVRSSAAADVLVEFAQTHQILFLTCQDHLVDLFAARQASVFHLPGSHWRAAVQQETHPIPAPAMAPASTLTKSAPAEQAIQQDRVQPDSPYWLHPESPIGHIPSLGEQMARRLGALGVRTVGELVELNPETVEMPLEALQISAATLRKWQSEARLLCCVPDLTGRDAQLLVICGIQSPTELAECDLATVLNQIGQIRARHSGDYETQWLTQRPDWPSQTQVERWIRSGRLARTWQAARDASSQRRFNLRHNLSRQRRRSVRTIATANNSQVKLHSLDRPDADEARWKFYLTSESPIVDAPSIGPRMAQRLQAIGIDFVSQLLAQVPADIANRLNRREVTPETVRSWQQQANLMCQVPQLRGHDVQVLVTCGIRDPETLATMNPAKLNSLVQPFVTSREGARLLRSARVPDLEEVTDWIRFAQHAPQLRAA